MRGVIKRITRDRVEYDLENQPAALLLDEAPQHNISATDQILLTRNRIHVVKIPAVMTHVYQPADQFIIPSMKHKIKTARNEMWKSLFSTNDVMTAVHKMCTTNALTLRQRIYNAIREASRNVQMPSILKSWHMCGIGINDPENQPGTNLHRTASQCAKEQCECCVLTSCMCPVCGSSVCFACTRDHGLYCTN